MASRYNVDQAQARRVAQTARILLDQCAETWNLTLPIAANVLDWASQLHEIGLDISHDGYQRHGAYIAENADLPGFPRAEQRLLAFLIANQGRQLAIAHTENSAGETWRDTALRLALLLRLAVLLNRSRTTVELPTVGLEVDDVSMSLTFPREWLGENPLTLADLEREQNYLKIAGISLDFI